eukprot:4798268-Prorocentrum_lima.AAC.1
MIGWMYMCDARKVHPLLTLGGVMQLIAQQPPDEKDCFLVLGICPDDVDVFYPWLIRANHGHG